MQAAFVRVSAVLLALASSTPAVADAPPARKPGWWEITSEMSVMPGQPMRMRQCIDSRSEADLMAQARQPNAHCSPPSITRSGAQTRFELSCRVEGSTAETRGVFTGDYQSSYRGDIHTRYTPPLRGLHESRMTLSARWLGPCPAGQAPGSTQMSIPGMGDVDLGELMKNLPKPPAR